MQKLIQMANIIGRSNTMNLQMELICHPTFGAYSRINIQVPEKISLGQDEKLSLTFSKIIRGKS